MLMISSVSLSLSVPSSHPTIQFFNFRKCSLYHYQGQRQNPKFLHHTTVSISFALRRHFRRRRHPEKSRFSRSTSPLSDQKLRMTINVEQLQNEGSLSMKQLLASSELKINQFVHSGTEALKDLRTLITVESDNRVVISCRRSTMRFLSDLALWCLVVVFSFRVLMKLGVWFRDLFVLGRDGELVYKRDRSLGGKEVVVGRKSNMGKQFRVSGNPSSSARGTVGRVSEVTHPNWVQRRWTERLPKWWPVLLPSSVVTVNKEEYQRMANGLIRAIMDSRMGGQDVLEDDIIQLRRICRTAGVRVSIDTTNARDTFYRASANFVLNICGSPENQSALVQIDGEDARQFIAGLAYNIGLENNHAARMVSAAVAARTRACFLQAWALEMQGKHPDAVAELSKICLIHQIFPPEEGSFEMELVARGLGKHLKVEQREYLMNLFISVCDEEVHRSVAEALGLVWYEVDLDVH